VNGHDFVDSNTPLEGRLRHDTMRFASQAWRGSSLWLLLAGAAYLATYSLNAYVVLRGPERAGFEAQFDREHGIVTRVDPATPAERAGLLPGDRLVAAGGQEIRQLADWWAIRANLEFGVARVLAVDRDGARMELLLRLERSGWSLRDDTARVMGLVNLAGQLVMLCLAAVIAFHARTPAALAAAALLAMAAVIQGPPLYGNAVALRALPGPFAAIVWITLLSAFVFGPTWFTFCSLFPRPLLRRPWQWALAWAPGLAVVAMSVPYSFNVFFDPLRAAGSLPRWGFQTFVLVGAAYLLVGAAALALNYRRLADVNERRRVRVVVVGWAIATLIEVPRVLFVTRGALPFEWPEAIVASLPFAIASRAVVFGLLPLSLTYAILRHRLFDIRILIRQGLRYALARGLVLSLVPAAAGVLIADLLMHGEQPLVSILVSRGWIYVALGAIAAAAHVRRRSWLDALDRRFFREQYDARRVLAAVVEVVRQAASFEDVAGNVTARVEAALHPEFAAMLVRQPGESSYRALASAPPGRRLPTFAAESKLVSLVCTIGKAVELSDSRARWLLDQLPATEAEVIRRSGLDLVVPFSAASGCVFLVLGRKRSEEPYTRDDVDLLEAIVASLALLYERPRTGLTRADGFEECPSCGSCYDLGVTRCPHEGRLLAVTPLPRRIGRRYLLERRLGTGGMGTVYAASDSALERRVALKVIREDRVGGTSAAERFRREALALAGFTHPNVVTVYDFGIVSERRPFLVMELLVGVTLRDELRDRKRLPAPQVLSIMRGVVSAVEAAHRLQLVHRDLKPENIFLSRHDGGETAKVLDFGIVKFLEGSAGPTTETGPGMLAGTLPYMPPEQLRGDTVEPAWDLWALGVVAYEMLAGTRPFTGTTPAELSVAAASRAPIAEHVAGAPPAWERFFARALAAQPGMRPGDARQFLAELERALA
jgi:tRNA A-37 threonylcarbamoyl transferase component Bud32